MELSNDIVDRVVNGDRNAQQVLYGAYSAKMYGICLRYFPRSDTARDVLHDSFVKVFTSMKSYRKEGSLEGWIRRIVVNTALEYFRRGKRCQFNELISASNVESARHQAGPDYQFLLQFLEELPPQYRVVFNLYAVEEYSHAEIANKLGITESTSKSNYSRAKAILRAKLDKIPEFNHEAYFQGNE